MRACSEFEYFQCEAQILLKDLLYILMLLPFFYDCRQDFIYSIGDMISLDIGVIEF